MKTTLTILSFIGLAACGSNPHRVAAVKVGDEYYKPEASAAMAIDTGSDEKIICKKRIVTGSHRKEKTCVTQKQMDRERRAAQENVTNNQIMNQRRVIDSKDGGNQP